MGVVLTVENRKGGVGKTTTAVTLAVGLARKLREEEEGEQNPKQVLIIDLDPQGDAATALGIDPGGKCISNVLAANGHSLDALRANVIQAGPGRENLWLIPASDALADTKTDLIESQVERMRAAARRGETTVPSLDDYFVDQLALAEQAFAYVILDCPPTLDAFQRPVHRFADYAVVPVKVDYHGTKATGRHTDNIVYDQEKGAEVTIAAIVPTMVDTRVNLVQDMLDSLRTAYGRIVTAPVPHTVRVAEGPAMGGGTILERLPEHDAAVAYQHLVDYIYKKTEGGTKKRE